MSNKEVKPTCFVYTNIWRPRRENICVIFYTQIKGYNLREKYFMEVKTFGSSKLSQNKLKKQQQQTICIVLFIYGCHSKNKYTNVFTILCYLLLNTYLINSCSEISRETKNKIILKLCFSQKSEKRRKIRETNKTRQYGIFSNRSINFHWHSKW